MRIIRYAVLGVLSSGFFIGRTSPVPCLILLSECEK